MEVGDICFPMGGGGLVIHRQEEVDHPGARDEPDHLLLYEQSLVNVMHTRRDRLIMHGRVVIDPISC